MTLLFIDTNILLDFYRQVGRESLSILRHIDQHHDRIITTRQVEMEFKKNRHSVIAKSLAELKSPDWGGLQLPAYLASSRQASGLSTGRKKIDKLVQTLKKHVTRVVKKPTQHDPVYKAAQRLFKANTPYGLSLSKEKEQKKVFRLAWRRFLLGYPPRKAIDTSIGDGMNWEWVVDCAKRANADVVIVSRDSDYGINMKGDGAYINDWLAQEFKERVNKIRNVTLTDRLSDGFKRVSIPVTKKEAADEERFLQRQWVKPDLIRGLGLVDPGLTPWVGPDLSRGLGLMDPGLALSRRLLKFSGGSGDDYATFSASVTSPSC